MKVHVPRLPGPDALWQLILQASAALHRSTPAALAGLYTVLTEAVHAQAASDCVLMLVLCHAHPHPEAEAADSTQSGIS